MSSPAGENDDYIRLAISHALSKLPRNRACTRTCRKLEVRKTYRPSWLKLGKQELYFRTSQFRIFSKDNFAGFYVVG
jgi:hypothetical protein